MASVKLTNTYRDSIFLKIHKKSSMQKESLELEKIENELYDIVRNDLMPQDLRDCAEKNSNYFTSCTLSYIHAAIGGTVRYQKLTLRTKVENKKPILYPAGISSYSGKVYIEGPIFDKLVAYAERKDKFETESSNNKNKIYAILDKANTTKQLKEMWPEIASLVEEMENDVDGRTGAAVNTLVDPKDIQKLNDVYGLPRIEEVKCS